VTSGSRMRRLPQKARLRRATAAASCEGIPIHDHRLWAGLLLFRRSGARPSHERGRGLKAHPTRSAPGTEGELVEPFSSLDPAGARTGRRQVLCSFAAGPGARARLRNDAAGRASRATRRSRARQCTCDAMRARRRAVCRCHGEPHVRLELEHRPEVADDAVCCRFGIRRCAGTTPPLSGDELAGQACASCGLWLSSSPCRVGRGVLAHELDDALARPALRGFPLEVRDLLVALGIPGGRRPGTNSLPCRNPVESQVGGEAAPRTPSPKSGRSPDKPPRPCGL
jgi:hypothetical protein